jgi:hypothetical protein
MGEVGAIEKSRQNQQQGYKFRGIDDVYSAFQHLLAKNGVFVLPTVLDAKREERATKNGGVLIYTTLTVKHAFVADDGSSVECVTVGEAMDSGDKSSNKAMSAAMKYALLEVFCVPTVEDKDSENDSPDPAPRFRPVTQPKLAPAPTVTEAQVKRLYAVAKQNNVDTAGIPDALADSFPYVKDATGIHLLLLKASDYDAAVKLFEGDDIPMDTPPAPPPAALPPGVKEFWPETEFDQSTEVIVASVAGVIEPVLGKSGKHGPHKVSIKRDDGTQFVVDTFDSTLAAVAKSYVGTVLHEVAFITTVSGKFTNRRLLGLR